MSGTCLAPGKVIVTGAYAVLEGAPALVLAVDRFAVAHSGETTTRLSPEFRAAFPEGRAPICDTNALRQEGRKLGLGSSAAALVAALGAAEIGGGKDPSDAEVRNRIFARAREAHRIAQGGGSGIDTAASTFGGALRYTLHAGRPWVAGVEFPEDLKWSVFFSGESAKTRDLLGRVLDLRTRDSSAYEQVMRPLVQASNEAAEQFVSGTARDFVRTARSFADALLGLAERADAPIFPINFLRLDVLAREEGGVFFPSGAGGGDIALFLGREGPSQKFSERAKELGMQPLALGIDHGGVRKAP